MRLIDADAVISFVDAGHLRNPMELSWSDKDVVDMIESRPTVDAVQVVHAYWIIKPHGTYGQLRAFCSACGKHSGIGGIVSNQKKPYCPNCGAIMDGRRS